MHPFLLSLALGVVEGLTEFLPVSSTAHLRIVESWAGLSLTDPYWKMFSVVIQLGAILSLLLYFRKRLASFFVPPQGAAPASGARLPHPLVLTLVAFVVTAVPALLLSKLIGKNLESERVMALSLIVGGLVMWAVDAACGRRVTSDAAATPAKSKPSVTTGSVEEMSLGQSAWVGFCQIFSAVFPGTSRSMATIAGGQLAGMSREAALEFSFLLSIPTMLAATGYELLKTMRHGGALGSAPRDAQEWAVLGIGFVVAFVVAYGVVGWFMRWVRSRGFVPFALYRIAFGTLVLCLFMRGV